MIDFKKLEAKIRDSGIPLIMENILGYILEVEGIDDIEVMAQIDEFNEMMINLLGGPIELLVESNKFLDKPQIQGLKEEAKNRVEKINKLKDNDLLTNKFQGN